MAKTKEMTVAPITNQVTISADELLNLKMTAQNQERLIGSLETQIDRYIETAEVEETKRKKAEKLVDDLRSSKVIKVAGEDAKVLVVSETTTKYCEKCGHPCNKDTSRCWNCGANISRVPSYEEIVETRNLDDVVKQIREKEAEALKVDVIALRKKFNDVKYDNEQLKIELKEAELENMREVGRLGKEQERISAEYEETIEDLKIKHRDEVKRLEKEYKKLKADKTDEQVEKKRKQEIIDLKLEIERLNKEIDELKKLKLIRRLFTNISEEKARLQAAKEKLERDQRVEDISNRYPYSVAKQQVKNKKYYWDDLWENLFGWVRH